MSSRPILAANAAALTVLLGLVPPPRALAAQEVPYYLRDRGTGVRTSLLGTYIRDGELLVYPFFEWYADSDLEYKPSELGHGTSVVDYRGRYRASEGILFLGYGISPDVAVELEAAVITASLEKAASDPSPGPRKVMESGIGDVEGQIRWRFLRENERRLEAFTFFETVFPVQRGTDRRLIGTRDWEFKLGFGIARGYHWGTLTVHSAAEYTRAERKFDAGEYAVEYLRQLSPAWRVVAAVEGNQVDEVALITEAQWHFSRHAMLKLNSAWGLTKNATDFAPEIGILFSF